MGWQALSRGLDDDYWQTLILTSRPDSELQIPETQT